MTPLANKGTFVMSRWTSERSANGDLAVTFFTEATDEQGVSRDQVLPPMKIIVQGTSPYKLLSWHPVAE